MATPCPVDKRVQERCVHSAVQWERLRTLKTAWDPDNVFRGNANIPPLG